MFERVRRKFETLSTQRRRIVTLDLLRGFFLLVVILDHSPLSPRITDLITGGGGLIVSAAEGFFIISGLLVGYLYAHKILLHTRTVLKKVWGRALTLYIASIVTTLVFTVIAWLVFDPTTNKALYSGSMLDLEFWRKVFSLSYTYGWADFLSRYAVFMFMAPIGLFLIALRKTYVLAILSIMVWFLSPVIGLQAFTAWQILFVFGMIIGSHLEEIIDIFSKKHRQKILYIPILVFLVSAGFSLYTVIIYHNFLHYLPLPEYFVHISNRLTAIHNEIFPYFNKEFMDLLRVVFAFIWFTALFVIVRRYEDTVHKYSYGLLAFLGKNTLTAYIIHAGIIFLLALIIGTGTSNISLAINTFVAVGAVALTVTLTWLYNTFRLRWGVKSISDNRHQGE